VCTNSGLNRPWSAGKRVALLGIAWLLTATPVLGQTAAGGEFYSIILKSDGTVWTVGQNASGQIGDNSTTSPRTGPYQVIGLSGIVAVASGCPTCRNVCRFLT
jgi:Regulator of chromosome condensation (RCC1) repeat